MLRNIETKEKYKGQELKKFEVPCSWEVYGKLIIYAPTIEEAIEEAERDDCPLPHDSSYVDGSFNVDHDVVQIHNADNNDEQRN